MTAGRAGTAKQQCLEQLAQSLRQTSMAAPCIRTREFVECCDHILPFFDHLGPVFHVARGEFQQKLDSLKQQSLNKPMLGDVVEADRKANIATVKNSATRNLHRLTAAMLFIKLLFEHLVCHAAGAAAHGNSSNNSTAAREAAVGTVAASSMQITLREAAIHAYEASLAPFHTAIVKGVVRAGMLTLPSKESFMAAIGETEESAALQAREVVAACQAVHASVSKLFDGIIMPASSVWLWPS